MSFYPDLYTSEPNVFCWPCLISALWFNKMM